MRSNNNLLALIVGALVVVVAGMGYYIYQEKQEKPGVEMKIGEGGVSIQKK
jgi:hypothetical protein